MKYSELLTAKNNKLVELSKWIGRHDNPIIMELTKELLDLCEQLEKVENEYRCLGCGFRGRECTCWVDEVNDDFGLTDWDYGF